MAVAVPAMATDSAYDIQILTTEATCDEIFSYTNSEGIVSYNWYFGIKLDAVIEGTAYSGITPRELEVLLYELYPDVNSNISYGNVAQPWVKGEVYTCNLAITIGEETIYHFIDVTVCDTTVTSVEAEITPYYAYTQFPDPVLTVTFADGSTLCSTSEYVQLSYTCDNWPTTVGTHTVSGYLGSVPMDATVTVSAMPVTIDSDIVLDELTGWEEPIYDEETGEETGETWTRYHWEEYGLLDATVNGTAYTDISFYQLIEILREQYGSNISYSYYWEGDGAYPLDPTASNPWQVGETYSACIIATLDGSLANTFLGQQINVVVQPTQIVSVSAAPVSYYAYKGYGDVEFTVTYADGSTGSLQQGISCVLQGDWPTTPGEHTVTYLIGDRFEVPVQVTVLPTPTSGKLGDTVSWSFDETTKTMTISGTGSAVCDMDIERDWMRLVMALDVEHVVVEEGVEALFELCFYMAPSLESISLPSSLTEIPLVFLGYNGSLEEVDLGLDIESSGITTFAIPEGITDWSNTSFYYTWGIQDLYLPSTLETVSLENLCYVPWLRQQMGLAEQDYTIHFAGTEAQWEEVSFVTPDDIYYQDGICTGLTEAELEELLATLTIVFEPAEETITVEDGVATIPDSVVQITEGEDVVIDVTDTEEEVSSVVIGAETVDKIAGAETSVEIKLPDAAVSFDAAAIGSIGEQAGETPVTIVVKEVEDTTLTAEQTAALKDKEVCVILTLEAYAGETKITEFGGGKVTVSVPFALPEGKAGTDYYVAYVAADGTVTAMPTTYADGALTFETTHFSNYVILENVTVDPPADDTTDPSEDPPAKTTPEADPSNPQTGDNSHLMLFVVLTVVSAACLTVCVSKRRAF